MQNSSSQADSPQTPTDRFSIGKSSKYLGVSIDTLRRWEKKGVVTAYRSPGGHRYFLRRDLDKLFEQKYTRALPSRPREVKIEPKPEEPQTISQDIGTEAPAQAKSIQEEPPPSDAIQQRQELEIKARELIRSPQPKPERTIPWSKILIIGIVLFVIADLILLTVYLTSSRPLISPIP
jgi:excisionase family DNA binding protein